jgi:hypothetical protein
LDRPAQQWTARPHDLRDRAVQIVAANPVNALQSTQGLVAARADMRRRHASDGPSGNHEHHSKIRQGGHGPAHDPLNRLSRSSSGDGRDRD